MVQSVRSLHLFICVHAHSYWPMFPETWFRLTKASWQWLDHVLQLGNLQSFPESIISALAFWIQIKAAKKTVKGVLLLQLQFIQVFCKGTFWHCVYHLTSLGYDLIQLERFLPFSIPSCSTVPITNMPCNAASPPLWHIPTGWSHWTILDPGE